MAPTAFHSTAAAQPEGEPAERQGHTRFPGKFPSKDINRAPVEGDPDDQKRRFVARQSQAARYHGQQGPSDDSAHPSASQGHQGHHPHQHQHQHHHPPQGQRRANNPKETSVDGKSFTRPAPQNPSIHKLGRPYTFSAYRRPVGHLQDSESYEKSIKVIGRFDTVEGFWAFYSHMQRPGELTGRNADYHLFAEGIAPAWEHDDNRRGGKFSILSKRGTVNRQWEDLLLAFVGDQFDYADEICGVVFSVRFKDHDRKRDTLSVWIKDTNHSAARERIGQQLRALLQLADTTDLDFKPHSASLQDLHTVRAPEEGAGD
eukprot:GGOE01061599.1.p1 GENE.GGOE01061599.1~~GGOE01061599.1.p1  ORF type:complete len:348 (+),score=48.96 GGOE01061599.1:99-1046(+)